MRLNDIKYKCEYCQVRSCGKRGRKFHNGKELTGVLVGCSSWKPTYHATALINQIINPSIF